MVHINSITHTYLRRYDKSPGNYKIIFETSGNIICLQDSLATELIFKEVILIEVKPDSY